MRTIAQRAVMAVCLWTVVAAVGMAAPKPDSEKAIRKELDGDYKAFTRAFQQRDEKAMWSMTTPDYTVKQPSGQVLTREQLEPGFRQQMAMSHDVKWARKITKLTVEGDHAVAMVDGRFTGKVDGQDKKLHPMVLVATTRDTWVKTPAGWKLQSSEVLKNQVTIDGKPTSPPPAPSKK